MAFLAVLAAAPAAEAAPTADVVVIWTPGANPAPVAEAARAHGAAAIDRSPATQADTGASAKMLTRGVAAYDSLRLDEARNVLNEARELADRTGAAGLTTAQLSDIFLYRALVFAQQGDDTQAWDNFVIAVIVDPTRELDPARFPPKVAEQLARAKESTLHDHPAADLSVTVPAGCATSIDGAPSSGKAHLITGPHWIHVDCADRPPWGQRVDLTNLGSSLAAEPPRYAPPTDDEMLVQARVAGARALVVAELHGTVATARLIALDGRERDRRAVAITGSDLAPLAAAVADLLTPPVDRHHWYQSRWAWAAGAAALAAIVLVPITAAIASDTGATSVNGRPKGPTF